MKVTREKTENSQAFLTIEMEPDEVEESMVVSYRRLAQKTSVPGFRKGKTPREILERYLGKESVLEEALNHLLPQACEKAIREEEIEAIARPQIEVTQTDPVIFKAVVPLPPTVELNDYHQIRVKPEPVTVTEDTVNSVMEELRHQHATWEPVERPVDFNDLVVFDIESDIEGKPFIKRLGAQYRVLRDAIAPAPGFAEQLAGISKGEEKEFKIKLPEDYPQGELAGKEPSFKVKVTEIKQEQLPELDDELAGQVSTDFKTLDSLKERIAADLKARAEEKARADFEERLIGAVVDRAQVEFPPILVELEIERMLEERARYLQMDGKGLEEYLKSINKTEEQIREELRPLATRRVTSSLVLGKVVGEEKIDASDAEIDAEIERMIKTGMENRGAPGQDELQNLLNTPQSRQPIKQLLMTRKAMERLTEIAQGPGKTKTKTKGKEKKNE